MIQFSIFIINYSVVFISLNSVLEYKSTSPSTFKISSNLINKAIIKYETQGLFLLCSLSINVECNIV